jgi:[acyl-carrier-protein] S-malonyltransferase
MAVALMFPGQGSQQIGMGAELADAFPAGREVFEEVDDALSQDLSGLMWRGEPAQLTLTENAQPALMAVSIAVIRVLEAECGLDLAARIRFVAGHSLGEYSALAAARAFSLTDTARLLKTRGRAMQDAVSVGAGAMAAILGLDLAEVEAIAKQIDGDGTCQPANDNAPGQVVISGAKAAVESAADKAKQAGARRAVLLDVSAPFHCRMMQPAADVMAKALAEVDIKSPLVPLIGNVTAGPVERPDEIAQRLVEQVTAMVRWRESVAYMAGEGVTEIIEIGAGKVLSGLARRIDRSLEAWAIGTPADIEKFAGR